MLLATSCFCSKVRRSSRRLMRLYDEALAPAGLTVAQFAAMRAIDRLDSPSLTRLAEATAVERSAMWRTLQPLAAAGLVTMGGTARKATAIHLTQAGLQRLEAAAPHWQAVQARINGLLGEDAKALFAALDKLETLHV
jgi:DNA-binding MarR family transcriptional regulator